MIRVDIIGHVGPSGYAYRAVLPGGKAVDGISNEPLLDACRKLKAIGVDPATKAAMFWPKATDWAARCSIGWGAAHIVSDSRFRRA